MTLSKAHRLNAKILGIFIALHLVNHAVLVVGRETHLKVMEFLRSGYRSGLIEYPLFGLFAVQIVLGLALIAKRGKPKGAWAWIQVLSGLYIAFFLLQHLGAIVMARMSYEFETTTYFAAAVVSAPPFAWYFFPYYVLGVTAVFTHIAAAARFSKWRAPAKFWHKAMPVVGFAFGLAVVTSLSYGAAQELPAENRAYLKDTFGH
ncbi:hypothetical protein [Planktotalea sp.]|uniref:hypothetical protein n=1 Tax=Planktotalea sp. TaxID=2029877 RepID=UPI003D6A57C3